MTAEEFIKSVSAEDCAGGHIYRRVSEDDALKAIEMTRLEKSQKVGEALNWIVFNEHERNIRNQYGEEKKQRELYELERKVADLINEGFIKNYDQMITYLKNVYRHKYLPAVFS